MRTLTWRGWLVVIVVTMLLAFVGRRVAAQKARAEKRNNEAAAAAQAGEAKPLADFSLSDAQGRNWSLAEAKGKLVVVAFLGTECPLAKLYAGRLNALAKTFGARGVAFVAVNSNSQDSLTEVAAYARQHALAIPMLKDVGNKVADQFGAQRTPQVFVLDADRKVRYAGRIDDQYGVGYTRDEPQQRDLQTALEELLAGKPVSTPVTEAVGCHIGRVQTPDANAKVTYTNQISRLLNKRCVECHREGEIAPFSLTDYDEVAGWAETLAEAVKAERMPPWHASPKHGKFAEDRRLTSAEKQLIFDWVAAGAPRGKPADLPPAPKFTETGWQIEGKPDVIIPMTEKPFTVKAEGEVRYQFFTVDPGFKEDKWVRAFEVQPGNRAVVHHTLVFARGAGASPLDAIGGFLAAYVPGLRAKPYPDGMAKRIPAGSKLVFQMHYTPNGSEQKDITKLALWFANESSVTREVHTVSAATRDFSIPPGAANHPVESRSRPAPANALLLALMPHMHVRGKSFRYELQTPGGAETLLDIPRYDFNWQTAYRLTEPLAIPSGARVQAFATYDNSEGNLNNPDPKATVRWGDQTYEEMMIGYMDIALPKGQALARGAEVAAIAGDAISRLDKNKDGHIERDEVPPRMQAVFDRLSGGKGKMPIAEVQKALEQLRGQ